MGGLCGCCIPLLLSRLLSLGLPLSFALFGGFAFQLGVLDSLLGLLSLLFLSFLFSRLSLLEGFLRVLPLLALYPFIRWSNAFMSRLVLFSTSCGLSGSIAAALRVLAAKIEDTRKSVLTAMV